MLRLAVSRRAFAEHFEPRGEHLRFYAPSTLGPLLEDFGFEQRRDARGGRIPRRAPHAAGARGALALLAIGARPPLPAGRARSRCRFRRTGVLSRALPERSTAGPGRSRRDRLESCRQMRLAPDSRCVARRGPRQREPRLRVGGLQAHGALEGGQRERALAAHLLHGGEREQGFGRQRIAGRPRPALSWWPRSDRSSAARAPACARLRSAAAATATMPPAAPARITRRGSRAAHASRRSRTPAPTRAATASRPRRRARPVLASEARGPRASRRTAARRTRRMGRTRSSRSASERQTPRPRTAC